MNYTQWSKIIKILPWFDFCHELSHRSAPFTQLCVECLCVPSLETLTLLYFKRQNTTHSATAVLISPLGSSLNKQGFTSTICENDGFFAHHLCVLCDESSQKHNMAAWWSPFWSISSYDYHALTFSVVSTHFDKALRQFGPWPEATATTCSKKSGFSKRVGNMSV